MTNLSKNQSVRIIANTCINKICPHPSNLEMDVTIQKIFDSTTGVSSYYQVALEGTGEPLVFRIPTLFNDSDLRSIANFVSKHIPQYYSMFDSSHCRKLAHKIFSFAEDKITSDAVAGLCIGKPEITDHGLLTVEVDRFAKNPAVKVSIIKGGKYTNQLNSSELRRFLKNNPKAIICGSKADLNYLERAITQPNNQIGYNVSSDFHEDLYHLMTNAHRLHYKLAQIDDKQLRFTKRGVPVIYDPSYTEEISPNYT